MVDPFPPRTPFQPRVIAATSIGTAAVTLVRSHAERPNMKVQPQKCEVREAGGKTGSITFKDCDGQEVGKLEWRNGQVLTEGDQEVEGGCDDSTSI
ncbi:hypothetical protein JIN84_17780 [Luteolibacter yonseiensis]|uniref:Uncharacterized protein n=1 Tax=Luteolibacter yonseiensis TaxID=1144680 RepID=A0A934VCT2_9BACT|nr:hypothetical protein [Luteolibacter yonseiensis]MBK1817475.1 hypothetical protein [Luteolibacter yonseiensis]